MAITRITQTNVPTGYDSFFSPLVKSLNRGLMVQWINADLINRAGCDIRKSVIMYDADYSFVMALPATVTAEEFTERLASLPRTVAAMETMGIRYWSVGLV